jgi:hypothetical protein
MNTSAPAIFLTTALAVMAACVSATARGAAIYENHVDVYKAITATAPAARKASLKPQTPAPRATRSAKTSPVPRSSPA